MTDIMETLLGYSTKFKIVHNNIGIVTASASVKKAIQFILWNSHSDTLPTIVQNHMEQ